jgi:S-adenosylmethionine:tRNA ribosyltransferase-isomerase
MKTEDFDYSLPREQIAQHPEGERSASRLLVFDRQRRALSHRTFRDVVDYLHDGDLLVLNDSRVFPARLEGRKPTGGAVDILLLEQQDGLRWTCLARGLRRDLAPQEVTVGTRRLTLRPAGAFWEVSADGEGVFEDLIRSEGRVPLPHYVKRPAGDGKADIERYQTVYADPRGSVAAPTAGFHFTADLLAALSAKGVEIVKLTLHIGVGTFFLIKTEDIEAHRMHRERFRIAPDTIDRLKEARRAGRRIIACGTSVVRTLETIAGRSTGAHETPHNGTGSPGHRLTGAPEETDLFIYPGYRFRLVDALITNFHLPRSTPLMLVAAFLGREATLECYRAALDSGYRFYSYGDAMLIL